MSMRNDARRLVESQEGGDNVSALRYIELTVFNVENGLSNFSVT